MTGALVGKGQRVRVIMFTHQEQAAAVLPAASFLDAQMRCLPPVPASYSRLEAVDVVIIDATGDLGRARALCQLLSGPMQCPPILLVLAEGGAAVLQADWGCSDFVLTDVKPAELTARMRLLCARARVAPPPEASPRLEVGDLVIDTSSYTVRLRGQVIDLTYKEFELLRYLAANRGKVFTRETLLEQVWGEDYIGGARTVDVHVRRLRAKLGAEQDHLIGTVRNVGYRLDAPAAE